MPKYKNNYFNKSTNEEWFNAPNLNRLQNQNILNLVINNMRENNQGNIIFISNSGVIGTSNYTRSKSSIDGLVKSLVLENLDKNILINSIYHADVGR